MFARRSHAPKVHHEKGTSLARGPAWIVGTILAVFGLMMFFQAAGTPLPTSGFPDGEAQGQSLFGFEANAWTAWLTTAAGVLVLIGAAQHALAKTMSLLVGLALGAMSVIALFDGEDVFGLAAANGLDKLAWGIAAAILIATALLPRMGGRTAETVVDPNSVKDRTAVDRDHDGREDRTENDPTDRDRDRGGRDDRTEVDHHREGTTPAPVATGGDRERPTTPVHSGVAQNGHGSGHDDRTEITQGRVVTRGAGSGPQGAPAAARGDEPTRTLPRA